MQSGYRARIRMLIEEYLDKKSESEKTITELIKYINKAGCSIIDRNTLSNFAYSQFPRSKMKYDK